MVGPGKTPDHQNYLRGLATNFHSVPWHAARPIAGEAHGQPDEIVVGRVRARRAAGCHLAGQLARIDLDRVFAPADRHAHPKALGIDQVGLGRQADQVHGMSAEQDFGGEQRAVGRAHDHDFESHAFVSPIIVQPSIEDEGRRA